MTEYWKTFIEKPFVYYVDIVYYNSFKNDFHQQIEYKMISDCVSN